MKVSEEMYTELFNGISDTRDKLESIIEYMYELQLTAEKLFVEMSEE